MAVVMIMHWAEVTAEQYEEARRKVNWEGDAPEGAHSHVAWLEDDGFHVVDVWDSQADFNRFVEQRLMPVVKGEMGIPGEPNVRFAPLLREFVVDRAAV
jgi:heme-degrading monooxygenase HmoA